MCPWMKAAYLCDFRCWHTLWTRSTGASRRFYGLNNQTDLCPHVRAMSRYQGLSRLACCLKMADKVAKAAVSAARRGAKRIYFPNRIIQFMSNQEKKVGSL